MSVAAALFGAGIGTLIYVFFTKAKIPVFTGDPLLSPAKIYQAPASGKKFLYTFPIRCDIIKL